MRGQLSTLLSTSWWKGEDRESSHVVITNNLPCSHGFLEYVDAVLLDERSSLNNQYVFQFLCVFFPKVADQVLTDQVKNLIQNLCNNLHTISSSYDLTKHSPVKHLNGDLR